MRENIEGSRAMDFIFMLTRQDRTVENCMEVLDLVAPVGLRHMGFKDVGVSTAGLAALNAGIKRAGATSYLEVVCTDRKSGFLSIEHAVEIGVDCVLGGPPVEDLDAVLSILEGTPVRYYPFAGFPVGHPTVLRGGAEDIAGHCARIMQKGCDGCDILAYRAAEDEPLALVRAARQALGGGRLIVAGSICNPGQIADVAGCGADAFTVGSAVFDGLFSRKKGDVLLQLRCILDAAAGAPRFGKHRNSSY